jgi:microcystin degradation protein MlrC
MKVFLAGLSQETNTFSPFVTGYRGFAERYLVRGGEHGDKPSAVGVSPIIWRRRAVERGWSVAESLCASAQPSGITLRAAYESFRDEILADLKQAMPVDMVLLRLHGAMVADGYDDCEGDLLAAIREVVGSEVPIGAELDLHCHLTQTMIDNATAIITFKEYPHIDFAERAEELFYVIADAAEGKVQPHMALYDCNMIGVYPTTAEPMRSFVDHVKGLEGKDGVLSVSIGHGFPWGDVPDLGTRVLVVTDNRPDHGTALAESLGRQLFDMRERIQPPYLTIEGALDRAMAAGRGPVVLADGSDNAGGGAPSDSTFILKALLDRGIENAAVACMWDPIAVQLAMEAGEGAQFDLRLGGKMGPMSGDPLDLHVTVTKIAPKAMQSFGQGPDKGQSWLGDTVALHANGIDIVANSIRTQVLSPDVFTNLGIDPTQKRILVVKSMQHFYAGFAPIAADILYVAALGALMPDLKALPYKKANRRMWPLSDHTP